jgi:hypothetical protein
MSDDIRKVRHAVSEARQRLEEAETRLDAMEQGRPLAERPTKRYLLPRRRKLDPAAQPIVNLAEAPDWIATAPIAEYLGCHPNGVLYYIDTGRLTAKRDGRRYLVSKPSAIALKALIDRHHTSGRPPN